MRRFGSARALLNGTTVPTGLVHHWPMATANSNALLSTDLVGGLSLVNASLSGTLSRGFLQIEQGYDLEVTATSNCTGSATSQGPQSGLTVSMWLKAESVVLAVPFSKYSTSTPAAAYTQWLLQADGSMNCRMHQVKDTQYIGRSCAAGTIVAGTVYLVAYTWDGGTTNAAVSIYVNGAKVDNANDSAGVFTGPYTGSDLKWNVGAQWDDQGAGTHNALSFDGVVEDARVYRRALTQSEIQMIYQAGKMNRR